MKNAIRAEWIKLRTLRSTIVLLFVAIGISLFFSVLPAIFVGRSMGDGDGGGPNRGDGGPVGTFTEMLAGALLSTFLFGVVAALVATSDFRFTIRPTLAAQPRRLRVLGAKAVVVALTTVVAVAVMLAISLGAAAGVLAIRHRHLSVGPEGWTPIAGVLLYAVLFALAGLAIGHIIRHSAGAIVALLLWPLLLEQIIGALSRNYFSWMTKWLPFAAGARLYDFADDTTLLGRWTGGLYFAGWVAGFLLLGAALLRRRDA